MANNRQVSNAWGYGRDVRNSNDTFSVTGNGNVYSYDLLIGYVNEDNQMVAIDFRAPNFISMTTSKHVSMIAYSAEIVREPTDKEYRQAW